VNQIHANARLSGRETEVLRLLGDGKTTPEIAAKLQISLKTVQQYCARLKTKLDAAKFNQLIRIAVLWRAGVAEVVVRARSA
jgi:DNA-binding CsgD family transcriptional regulator